MPTSLLTIRKRLEPLVWLLGCALLVSASPHLAQGLVLCFGDDHVEVEASGPSHHAPADSGEDAPSVAVLSVAVPSGAQAQPAPGESPVLGESNAPSCIDVPLRAARGSDLCHQAVSSSTARADVLLAQTLVPVVALPSASATSAAQEVPAHPRPSPDVPAASSLRALSSVVLLI